MKLGNRGMSLVELTIAMFVTTTITALAFYVYVAVAKNSKTIHDRFYSVSDAANLKNRIDGELRRAERFEEARVGELVYKMADGSTRKIEKTDDGVVINGEKTGIKVLELGFDLAVDSVSGRQRLLWDAVLKDSVWVGGAK